MRADPTLPDFSVVVPTYNECDRLTELVERIFAVSRVHHLSPEVVIVDDDSPDGTGDRAEALRERFRVRVIHRASKLGLATAVLAGIAAASGHLVVVMDADLSHPPEYLPLLLSTLVALKVDMVVASRYVNSGRAARWSWIRRMMSKIACWAASPLTPVRDSMSGFFVMRRDLIAGMRSSAAGFKIGLEILVRARPASVAEIGYTFTDRTAGNSKMSFAEVVRYGRQLVGLARFSLSRRLERPRYHVIPAPEPMALALPVVSRSSLTTNAVHIRR
jgi:dolichol-phosphate mannosyltransferase